MAEKFALESITIVHGGVYDVAVATRGIVCTVRVDSRGKLLSFGGEFIFEQDFDFGLEIAEYAAGALADWKRRSRDSRLGTNMA